MNAQEVFDQVVSHLRKQNAKSRGFIDDEGTCLYRATNGFSCAVGCLIKDEEYSSDMEGYDLKALYKSGLLPASFKERYGQEPSRLLLDLQGVHDNMHIGNWELGFQNVAAKHGLMYTPKG